MANNLFSEADSHFGGKKYFPLVIILILGTILRFYHNLDISLWHDEAFSALLIKYPWQEMFYRIGLDVHPPMYYIFLKFWYSVFGDSLLSLREFSVLFGVLGIWAVWLFVKQAFHSEKMALWAALLVALNPFTIGFSTEARMYTFGAFFAILAAYFLVKALRQQKQYVDDFAMNMPNLPKDIQLRRGYILNFLWFTVCTAIIILTHYYLLFTAAALMLYGLWYCLAHYRTSFARYFPFLASCLLVFLAFLPWLKTFLFQYRQVGAGYWIPPMDLWSIPGTLWTMLLGIGHDNANPLTQKILLVVVLFSLLFFYRFLKKTQAAEKWLVALCTLAPFGGAILFAILAHLKGSKTSVYEERYFLFCSTFYLIALAAWVSEIKPKWFSVSLFASYCLFNVYAFAHNWNGLGIQTKPGMNGTAKYLAANVEPGHHVFVGTSYEFFNYKYYNQAYYPTPARPLLFTGGRKDISQISHVEGVALLTNQDLVPNFSQAVKSGDTVWLLWTKAFGSDKPDVPKNWGYPIDEKEFPDVRPYVGTSIYITEYKVN